jgi:hypothetical protein
VCSSVDKHSLVAVIGKHTTFKNQVASDVEKGAPGWVAIRFQILDRAGFSGSPAWCVDRKRRRPRAMDFVIFKGSEVHILSLGSSFKPVSIHLASGRDISVEVILRVGNPEDAGAVEALRSIVSFGTPARGFEECNAFGWHYLNSTSKIPGEDVSCFGSVFDEVAVAESVVGDVLFEFHLICQVDNVATLIGIAPKTGVGNTINHDS